MLLRNPTRSVGTADSGAIGLQTTARVSCGRPLTHAHAISCQRQPPTRDCRALPRETAQQVLIDSPPKDSFWSGSSDEDGDGLQPGPSSTGRVAGPQVAFVSLVDGKFTVRGRLILAAPASLVYSLLTDYAACDRVFSNIAASEVVQRPGGGLEVIQSCRWNFLAFTGTFKVHLGVQEEPQPGGGGGTLLFNLIHSNFMRDFEGRWVVRPVQAPAASSYDSVVRQQHVRSEGPAGDAVQGQQQQHHRHQQQQSRMPLGEEGEEGEEEEGGVGAAGGGGEGQEWCEVEHLLSVVPAVPVPPPVSYYTRSIFVRQVEGILTDLQRGLAAAMAAEAAARS